MATLYATNSPLEAPTAIADANDVEPRQLTIPVPLDEGLSDQSGPASGQPSPRINLPPPPNPPFVFPARPASSSAPSSFSRATGRRPQSAIEIPSPRLDLGNNTLDQPRRSPALPDFSFNPGGALSPESAARHPRSPALPDFYFNPGAGLSSDTSKLSPPLSPQSPRTGSTQMGHRRGGSEFVGGQLRAGESITVMSTSPTKSESGYASPKLAPANPSASRRGHAHRRSAAISSHDLSAIITPRSPNPSRGSSAPTSPADFDERPRPFPKPKPEAAMESPSTQESSKCSAEDTLPGHDGSSSPKRSSPKPATRARVGFSDTLEYIPRPLSLVSTDTASTITGRPGHSVSGSISSIISATNSMSTDRDPPGLLGSPVSLNKSGSRPSTAGAVLERTPSLHVLTESSASPRRRNSIPLLTELSHNCAPASPALSETKASKRWSFFNLEHFSSSSSPTKSRPISPGSSDANPKIVEVTSWSDADHSELDTQNTCQDESLNTGVKKKKQKKVKSWAGSILTRKSKSRTQKAKARRRSQTPPLRRHAKNDDDLMDSADIHAMMELEDQSVPRSSDVELTGPRRKVTEDETAFPMIDLDAALGPFNTPSSRDPQWEEAQRAGAPPKRQLHSAAGMRGFSGPGMHYHRRAESAPEMPPFEAGRFGIHRFGSSSTMADVFEEDEEDDDAGARSPSEESLTEAREASAGESESSSETDEAASTPTQERDHSFSVSFGSTQVAASVKRKGSGSSLEMQRPGSRMRTEASSNSLHEEVIIEETSYQASIADAGFPAASDTSDSTAPSPRRVVSRETGPADTRTVVLPAGPMMPNSPYSLSHSSSFPSPRSPMSYDAHRISTAPSSVTDENNFQSLLMGEPGPEVVRISVDVPSLTSSNSTMTRESMFTPGVRPRNMPFHDQRPASFTSTAFGRRRSSLASLSRLISSAHGERSKLSMEVPVDNESEKKLKSSKSKRLSRKLQFWKPKSSTES
ncbi:hypothetical protein F5Y15DRAFT_195795 [Xylariaceae sp. FL0016]|nr:hypothetical protein F5Y15DRAFT_195795 [Xylariaceae sp. FL0016]